MAARLDTADLPLYAQHIDKMNLQTLLAMFREDPESCLLGTDAVRDGIDVPGAALRLIVFDRMPWPRSDILFSARAKMAGARSMDGAANKTEAAAGFWTFDPPR